MQKGKGHRSNWENFLPLLSARFPHLQSQCLDLATVSTKTIAPEDDQPGWIEAEFWNGLARITVVQDKDHPEEILNPLTTAAMEHELETLRGIGEDSPQLNPALVDLTGLPAHFLIGRLALFSFLDRLRDQNRIPEPKDYSSWRGQMVALESVAAEGNYHETWLLPNGQTLRVTGKPHPNGAITFLMEDISDEIFLTLKFRSQIDTSAAVIDNLTAAVSVFSSSGSLIMANRAYRDLWGTDVDGSIASWDFSVEMTSWKSASAPSPVWMKLTNTLKREGADLPIRATPEWKSSDYFHLV